MKKIRKLLIVVLALLPGTLLADSSESCGMDAKPCLDYGAKVFAERCSLCHGSDGLGEGILSMSVKDYPETSLLEAKHGKDIASLKKVITYGGGLDNISEEMPPWGDELTATQLDSVVMFNELLISNTEKALELLKTANASLPPSVRNGRGVFKGRCALCHGKYGLGDGKMARIIKNPPPFNLTKSRMPDDYLSDIIHKGGKAMGRSQRMPPFGGDLSESDIKSVIMYIKTLRTDG